MLKTISFSELRKSNFVCVRKNSNLLKEKKEVEERMEEQGVQQPSQLWRATEQGSVSQGWCRDQEAAQCQSGSPPWCPEKDHNKYLMHVPLAMELNENIFYYVTTETGQKENQLVRSHNQKSQLKVQNSTSLFKQ